MFSGTSNRLVVQIQHSWQQEMPTHGKISLFDPETESWTSYCERLGFYFISNNLMEKEEKKKAIFLSVCGAQTYHLLKNLLQPEKLADKRYDELIAVLENHYEPKQSVIVQRYKFNTRVRLSGKSVAAYEKLIYWLLVSIYK